MTDNDVIAKIIELLNAKFAAWPYTVGYGPVEVQQKQQPTKQGIPSAPTVFIEKLFDHRYGWVAVLQEETSDPTKLLETENQLYNTTFQISALALQDPSRIDLPTASDLCSDACAILQSRYALQEFTAAKIAVFRVSDVQNNYVTDDQDRQEAEPSFDIVLSYTRTIATPIDKISRVDSTVVQVS